MKKTRTVWAILGLAAVLAASPAAAQDQGIYLGGSLGYSQFKETCDRATVPCDDNDTAWRAFAGYQFNRYVSAELGYGDLGAATGSGAAGSFEFQTKAWDLSALGSIPVAGGLSAFARLGVYSARTTVDQRGPLIGTIRDAKTDSGLTYGAGLGYNLWRLGVRLEWQRYSNVGSRSSTGEETIDVFGIGALFRF